MSGLLQRLLSLSRHDISVCRAHCPIAGNWYEWDIDNVFRRESNFFGQAAARRLADSVGVADLGQLVLPWTLATDDPLVLPSGDQVHARYGLDYARHIHADAVVLGNCLHVDVVTIVRSQPARFLQEAHVYQHGNRIARAWMGRDKHGNRDRLPLIAPIEPHAALLIDWPSRTDEGPGAELPVTWLWDVDDPGTIVANTIVDLAGWQGSGDAADL
ncbi:MAG: hypothetical protein IT178_18555 [Acidobacteria bacterium]|nr:hypothetical protein [Acidobacteriota bacterium]